MGPGQLLTSFRSVIRTQHHPLLPVLHRLTSSSPPQCLAIIPPVPRGHCDSCVTNLLSCKFVVYFPVESCRGFFSNTQLGLGQLLTSCRGIITARKRNLRKLCFYTCQSFCPREGEGCLAQCMLGYNPLGRHPLSREQ